MANPRKPKDPESTMEEATGSFIRRAFELARQLESNFPDLVDQPHTLFTSIDEIVKTLLAAKESLRPFSQHPTPPPPPSSFAHQSIRSNGHAQPMDQAVHDQTQRPRSSAQVRLGKRSNSRRSDLETKTVMADAPRFGNTEIPPEDGFTWRKYGQKDIFGSSYPRSYYRCTHQKTYKCPAKKQVQRLDNNPNTFAVTYHGSHSCIMSSTAPSSVPPPHLFPDFVNATLSPQLSSSSTPVSRWLPSPHLGLCTGGAASAPPGVDAAGMATAGPSTSRYASSTDYVVGHMADTMFNSTGSSAIESFFLFPEDKWEHSDKTS